MDRGPQGVAPLPLQCQETIRSGYQIWTVHTSRETNGICDIIFSLVTESQVLNVMGSSFGALTLPLFPSQILHDFFLPLLLQEVSLTGTYRQKMHFGTDTMNSHPGTISPRDGFATIPTRSDIRHDRAVYSAPSFSSDVGRNSLLESLCSHSGRIASPVVTNSAK